MWKANDPRSIVGGYRHYWQHFVDVAGQITKGETKMTLFDQNLGICAAARAVAAHLNDHDGVENSWDNERKEYAAQVQCAAWYNGRERGYVFSVARNWGKPYEHHWAVFEHRNTDSICVVEFQALAGINPPTWADTPEGTYKDKWDVSKSFAYNEAYECAAWVYERMEALFIPGGEA